MRESVLCHKAGEHLHSGINLEKEKRASWAESPPYRARQSRYVSLDGMQRSAALARFLKLSTLVGKYFSFTYFFKEAKIF